MSGEFESGGGKRRAYRAQLSLLRCGGVRGQGTGLAVATCYDGRLREAAGYGSGAPLIACTGGGLACCEVVCNAVVTLMPLRPHNNDTKRVMHEKVS